MSGRGITPLFAEGGDGERLLSLREDKSRFVFQSQEPGIGPLWNLLETKLSEEIVEKWSIDRVDKNTLTKAALALEDIFNRLQKEKGKGSFLGVG